MEDFWKMICDDSSCSSLGGNPLCFGFEVLKDPSSCINHLLIIVLDVLFLIMLTFVTIQKTLLRPIQGQNKMEKCSKLQLVSEISSGSLGLLHLCFGIWALDENLKKNITVFPLNLWLLELLQGLTWMTVLLNIPLAKLQHRFLSNLMLAQDERLKASSEALVNVKVLKLYAWDIHFKNAIESLRIVELKWLSSVLLQKAYSLILFWFSPILVSTATFMASYFMKVPLHANNVFTFIATMFLVQEPISTTGDVIGVIIQAHVSFSRVVKFLEAPELHTTNVRKSCYDEKLKGSILIKSANFSWEDDLLKPTIADINLKVCDGQKIAIFKD